MRDPFENFKMTDNMKSYHYRIQELHNCGSYKEEGNVKYSNTDEIPIVEIWKLFEILAETYDLIPIPQIPDKKADKERVLDVHMKMTKLLEEFPNENPKSMMVGELRSLLKQIVRNLMLHKDATDKMVCNYILNDLIGSLDRRLKVQDQKDIGIATRGIEIDVIGKEVDPFKLLSLIRLLTLSLKNE